MKKVLFLCLIMIAIFVTGCGNESSKEANVQKLVCSQKVQTIDVNMLADFKDDVLSYLGLKYTMDLTEFSDVQIDAIKAQDMCATVKQSMSNYTDAFTNCKQGVENKILIITADFDLDKLITGEIKKEAKLEDIKTSLEKQNYVCTINK